MAQLQKRPQIYSPTFQLELKRLLIEMAGGIFLCNASLDGIRTGTGTAFSRVQATALQYSYNASALSFPRSESSAQGTEN